MNPVAHLGYLLVLKKPKEIINTPYTQLRWIFMPTCSFLLLFPVFVGGQESLALLEGININYVPQTRSSGCCITCRQICFWLVGFNFHCHWTKLIQKQKHREWQFMTDFKITIIQTERNTWVVLFPTSGSRSSSIDSVSSLISGSPRDASDIPRAACSSLSVIPVVSMQNPIWISGQDDSETQLW